MDFEETVDPLKSGVLITNMGALYGKSSRGSAALRLTQLSLYDNLYDPFKSNEDN